MPIERPALKEARESAPAVANHRPVSAIESLKSFVIRPPAIQTPATVLAAPAAASPAARRTGTPLRRLGGAGTVTVMPVSVAVVSGPLRERPSGGAIAGTEGRSP